MIFNRHDFCGVFTLTVSLFLLGCGTNGNSYVRTVNASPGLVDYTVQVAQTGIASSLPYGTEGVQQPGQYASTDTSGNYRLIGAGANQEIVVYTTAGSPPLTSQTQSLLKNSYYTIMTLNPAPSISLLTLTDDNTAPASGNYNLRFVQSSPSSGAIDVYLVPPGTNLGTATPTLSNLLFGQVTIPYLSLTPGTYELQVTPHGNPGKVLVSVVFSPKAGNIYSAFALDPAPGSNNFGLLITTDPVSTTTTMASGTGG